MLAHRLRRCSSFNPALFQCVVFARMHNMVLYILDEQTALRLIDQQVVQPEPFAKGDFTFWLNNWGRFR